MQESKGTKAWAARHKALDSKPSILAQADVRMVTIQRILRHKNLMTTERYIRGLGPVKPALEILSYRNSRPKVPTLDEYRSPDLKKAI